MRYAICYDAADDRTRERIARALARHGDRVQLSVFECELSTKERARLTTELRRLLADETEVNVRVYRLCADCRKASFGLGEVAEPFDGKPWIVI